MTHFITGEIMDITKYYIYGFKVLKPTEKVDDGGAVIPNFLPNQIFSAYLEWIKSDERIENEKVEGQLNFRLYCDRSVDVCFKDLICDPDGKQYDIKGIQDFAIGRNPHKELMLLRRI